MQKVLLAISLVFIGVNSYAAELNIPNVLKTGDASNGSSLVATCAACHGNDGNSVNTDWPSLAGQNQKYLYDQLVYFVNGERENALMTAVIPYLKTLSADELLDVAAYYSESSASVGQADSNADLLALGESLYRAGDLSRGIPACTAPSISAPVTDKDVKFFSGGSCVFLEKITFSSHSGQTAP